MKLNKTELTVMASRIQKNLKYLAEEAQVKCNKLSDTANKKAAQKIHDSLKALPLITKQYIAGKDYNGVQRKYVPSSVRKILKSMRVKQTTIILFNSPCSSEIYEELVLAQIGAENLDAIADIVTNKFIK